MEIPCGVVVNVQDCEIAISEFELLLRNYIHFSTDTFEKGVNPLIPTID